MNTEPSSKVIVEVADEFAASATKVWRLLTDRDFAALSTIADDIETTPDGVRTYHLSEEVWMRTAIEHTDHESMLERGVMVESQGMPLSTYSFTTQVVALADERSRVKLRGAGVPTCTDDAVSGMLRSMYAVALQGLERALNEPSSA